MMAVPSALFVTAGSAVAAGSRVAAGSGAAAGSTAAGRGAADGCANPSDVETFLSGRDSRAVVVVAFAAAAGATGATGGAGTVTRSVGSMGDDGSGAALMTGSGTSARARAASPPASANQTTAAMRPPV